MDNYDKGIRNEQNERLYSTCSIACKRNKKWHGSRPESRFFLANKKDTVKNVNIINKYRC